MYRERAEEAVDGKNYKRARRLFRLAGYGYQDIVDFYDLRTANLVFIQDKDDEVEVFMGCVWRRGKYAKLHRWNGLAPIPSSKGERA